MKKNTISYGKENDLNLKAFIGLSRTTQGLHRRAGAIFNQGGLTSAQFAVLEALYHKGDLTISEIIASILSTSGNMTVVINNLEKDAMIERQPNPNDKRSCIIAITDKGREKIEEIFPRHVEDLAESFTGLYEEEKEMLLHLLKKIKTRSELV
ncbi:MarR family transcriptional regulator [Clostridium sp. HBUAS56010]|uniref:MarR family winged helix-turn-helix transcriptional regulator n=1 Tax=Clostridium sp. HBUAS56010 TaxID=2571127 RepID=UPI001177F813|nr:MarR family transcriptional regulator [Clostridium sp. HBUAS56010]